MLHFIESRLQKYADTWWEPYKENHPHFKHWWDNTRQNATTICPDDLLEFNSISSTYNTIQSQKALSKGIIMKTSISSALKSSNIKQLNKLTNRLAYVWCGSAYITGTLDATFQQYHQDMHIGMAITDWFIDTGESVHHWYSHTKQSIHNWWENEDHWWDHKK